MANGYRISESGDFRVAEDASSRITEGFNLVEITLSATGSVASVGGLTTGGSADLAATGSKVTAGAGTLLGVVDVNASTTLIASAIITKLGDSALTALGTQSAEGIRIRYGVSPLSATGSQVAAAEKTLFGKFQTGAIEFTRVLENGDTRHTEAGDTRISVNIFGNTGEGHILTDQTKTLFTSQPYYNDEDTWKTFVPYVKHNGSWITNIKIYKHTNGAWKRSY